MNDIKLSDQQISFFRTFGYLALPGLMKDRIDEITDAFERLFQENGNMGYDKRPHNGTATSSLVPFIDQSEYLSSLLDEPRIHGVASTLLGDDFNYMGSDGNFYVGDTHWHSDSAWQNEIRNLKVAFYLDSLTRDTGCLRVIPGSHQVGDAYAEALRRDISACQGKWNVAGRDVPSTALEVTPGDVVVFDHNLKHAAFGGGKRRRMFTINCSERYPEHLIPQLRSYISDFSQFGLDEIYGPAMLRTATPSRLKHLQQAMDNDDHLPELSRQARQSITEPARV